MAPKKDYFTSPQGRAEYPHLVTPDTKFDSGGKYKTNLIVEGPEAQAFREAIDERMEQNAARIEEMGKTVGQVRLPYEELEDGRIKFTFKSNASGETRDGKRFTRTVAIFDAAGQPITDLDSIGGGSLIRVAGDFYPWGPAVFGSGVTLRLSAVQVIALEEWSPEAETYGFGQVEGGFSASDQDEDEGQDDVVEPAGDGDDFNF